MPLLFQGNVGEGENISYNYIYYNLARYTVIVFWVCGVCSRGLLELSSKKTSHWKGFLMPRGSMQTGIFIYMYHRFKPNVGKCTIHLGNL